jgi:excisionase family DNA binding protein
MTRWLTLSAASKLLGVHPATLRQWADAGKVPSYRTPGGHRRFRAEDIRVFLMQASHSETTPELSAEESLFTTALVETRRDLQQSPPSEQLWYSQFDEEGMANQRQLGRALFEKAIRYLTLPAHREELIIEGRDLGHAYAFSSLKYNISLLDTVRAFQYFRQKLLRSLTNPESGARLTEQEDMQLREDFDTFFDEVLFGLIDTYERQLLDNQAAVEAPGQLLGD